MQAILSVTIPFFALVLCGYLAARSRLLPESAIPGLNAYVLFFALPCMLYRFGASMPLARLLDPTLLGLYASCSLLLVSAFVALTWRRGGSDALSLKDAAFGALVGVFPNSGFMGVPLLAALLGEPATGPVMATLLVDLFITTTLCLVLAQAGGQRVADGARASPLAAALRSLRGAATNPQPWAIALGALAGAMSFELPGPIAQVLRMLADSASPVALFTIGAVLWRAGQHAHSRTPLPRYLPLALAKLFLHPLLVGAAGLALRALGAPITDLGLTALVLTAALPSASNVSLLAERFGADNGRVARIIMASTALAFVSFSLIAWALLNRLS
ncbi:MAG TPA: AEC family transporter [Burkholderiaceae bacterium]|nr:AEC family transporter [Burkholderiaceae bacterium]